MINKEEAKVDAWVAIADLVGKEYFKERFDSACHAYPQNHGDRSGGFLVVSRKQLEKQK